MTRREIKGPCSIDWLLDQLSSEVVLPLLVTRDMHLRNLLHCDGTFASIATHVENEEGLESEILGSHRFEDEERRLPLALL